MAERRMVSKAIIEGDNFIELTPTSQLLYFHLLTRADDEGFVNNSKSIMKLVDSSESDLALLKLNGYVITFNSGVLVISHWNIHNTIRRDRFKESKYVNEKAQLYLDEMFVYRLNDLNTDILNSENQSDNSINHNTNVDNQQIKTGYQKKKDGNQISNIDNQDLLELRNLSTQNSIDKVSLDKYSIEQNSIDRIKNDLSESEENCSQEHQLSLTSKNSEFYGICKNVVLSDSEYEMLVAKGINEYIDKISLYMKNKDKKYSNHYDTILRWHNSAIEREKNDQKHKGNSPRSAKFSIKPGVSI